MLQYSFLSLLFLVPTNGLYYSLPSCYNTVRAYEDIFRGFVFPGLTSSRNVFRYSRPPHEDSLCNLERTCCSPIAEKAFFLLAMADKGRSILDQVKASGLPSCRNHAIFGETERFIQQKKSLLVRDLNREYSQFYHVDGQVDRFFEYLSSSVHTGDVSDLPVEFTTMFLNVSLATFLANPITPSYLPTKEFQECFHGITLESSGYEIQTWLNGFQRSYNKTLQYFRALRAVDQVVDALLHLKLSNKCRQALMKMTSCAQCAGLPRGVKACLGLCQNVLRGCLLDLGDLIRPIRDFSRALIAMKTHVMVFNLYDQITLTGDYVFKLITYGVQNHTNITIEVNRRCPLTQGSLNRPRPDQVVDQQKPKLIQPLSVLNDSAYCLLDKVNMLAELPESLCRGPETSSENRNCWNGKYYGGYSVNVVKSTRSEQAHNPEVKVCTNHRQFSHEIRLLHFMTRELNSLSGACSTDDEDCMEVPLTTQYYDLDAIDLDSDQDSGSGSGEESGESGGGSGEGVGSDSKPGGADDRVCDPEVVPSTP